MNVDDLYPMWIGQARDELHEHVDRMQRGYDKLVHKDSTYGRSIKAMLDLRIRLLATCDAAPRQLDAANIATPPQPVAAEVAAFDAAVAAELPRVSHVQFDSHEICKHFAENLRKRMAGTGSDESKGEA